MDKESEGLTGLGIHSRTTVRWPVCLVTPDSILEGETENINLEGVLISCRESPPHEGTFLLLELPDRPPLRATVKLAWTTLLHSDDGAPMLGAYLQFVSVGDADRRFLEEFLAGDRPRNVDETGGSTEIMPTNSATLEAIPDSEANRVHEPSPEGGDYETLSVKVAARLHMADVARSLGTEFEALRDLRSAHSWLLSARWSMHRQRPARGRLQACLVITPGDRSDIILGTFVADRSPLYPRVAGLVLTGNLKPAPQVQRLIEGLNVSPIPVLGVPTDSFTTAMNASAVRPTLLAENKRKVAAALGIVESCVDVPGLLERAAVSRTGRVTPLMFQYELVRRAKLQRRHIVLPEGTEERILRAAEIVLLRDVCDITLLGDAAEVRQKASSLGLVLDRAKGFRGRAAFVSRPKRAQK